MPKKPKRKLAELAQPEKKSLPHPTFPDEHSSNGRLCWRFRHVDHEGPWGFDKVSGQMLCEIMKKLAQFESMTAAEVFTGGTPGRDYDIAEIPTSQARQRLEDLGLSDQTRISRLELQGKWRLYGFRLDNVFHVIWWDPEHEIWPSPKKRT